MTNLNTPSTNVIKGTGEVYYADAGTKPPPGINLPPTGDIVVGYRVGTKASLPTAAPTGAAPVVVHNFETGAGKGHTLHVWQANGWLELTNVTLYRANAAVGDTAAAAVNDYWAYGTSTDTPYGWQLKITGSSAPATGVNYTGNCSGWDSVGAISKSGIDFGASPTTAFVYESNSHYALDAHDVAVDDMFSIALLQSTLKNIFHLVHGETVATFDGGSTADGHLTSLRYLRDGGPEKTKRGISILHDGFGASNKPDVNDPVRRRLWLPRAVNGGSPPRTMADATEQALVLPMKILKSFVNDTIPNLGVSLTGLAANGAYLNGEQPPIEYWEDIYS